MVNRGVRWICASLACAAAAGCYSYTAVPVENAPAGAAVRTRISAAEAERVREALGREDRVLQGVVVGANAETLLLSVRSVAGAPGMAERGFRQNLPIPRSEVVELEIRRLNPVRTGVLVGGAAALVGYLVYEAFDVSGSAPGAGRPGGEEARVPLISIPIR